MTHDDLIWITREAGGEVDGSFDGKLITEIGIDPDDLPDLTREDLEGLRFLLAMGAQAVTAETRYQDGTPGPIVGGVLLSASDNIAEGWSTFFVGLGDVPRLNSMMARAASVLTNSLRRIEREDRNAASEARRREAQRRSEDQIKCSAEGCRRPRRYIGTDGQSYCKRHAEEAGVRPTGRQV